MAVEQAAARAGPDVVDDDRRRAGDRARLGDVDVLARRIDLEVVQHGQQPRHAGREVVVLQLAPAARIEGDQPRLATPVVAVVERPQPALPVDAERQDALEWRVRRRRDTARASRRGAA